MVHDAVPFVGHDDQVAGVHRLRYVVKPCAYRVQRFSVVPGYQEVGANCFTVDVCVALLCKQLHAQQCEDVHEEQEKYREGANALHADEHTRKDFLQGPPPSCELDHSEDSQSLDCLEDFAWAGTESITERQIKGEIKQAYNHNEGVELVV